MEKGSRLQKTSKLSADEIGKSGSETVYVWEGTQQLINCESTFSKLNVRWPQGTSDFNAQIFTFCS